MSSSLPGVPKVLQGESGLVESPSYITNCFLQPTCEVTGLSMSMHAYPITFPCPLAQPALDLDK
ncbi:MAG: hypothetical protein ACKODS_04420, partial [Methylophilaceae bacterium]